MEKEQWEQGSRRRGRAGSCGQRGNPGLCGGELGKELLTANFRARFRREEIPRRLPCGWKFPQRCLKVSIHEVMNDDVPVLAGRSPERDVGWRDQQDTGQQGGFPVCTLPALDGSRVHRDKPLVPRERTWQSPQKALTCRKSLSVIPKFAFVMKFFFFFPMNFSFFFFLTL